MITNDKNIMETQENISLAYRTLGNIEYNKGNYQMAIKYYEKSMEKRLANPSIYQKLGVCYTKIGDKEKATFCFQRV